MNAATQNVNSPAQPRKTPFTVADRQVPCPHNIQFYVDYGSSDGGPWVRFGFNSSEIGIGFLPIQEAELKIAPK